MPLVNVGNGNHRLQLVGDDTARCRLVPAKGRS